MSTRSIRIPELSYQVLVERSKSEGRTITEIARRAVASYALIDGDLDSLIRAKNHNSGPGGHT